MRGPSSQFLRILGVFLCATPFPLGAQIGWTLEKCIAEYGPVVKKYGDNPVSLPEYEFVKDGKKIVVILADGKVVQWDLNLAEPLTDQEILAVLRKYSGIKSWEKRSNTEVETTGVFPSFDPDSENHKYYRTAGKELYGMVKYDWVGDLPFFVEISVPNFHAILMQWRRDRSRDR